MKTEKMEMTVSGDSSPEPLVLIGHEIEPSVIEKIWRNIQQELVSRGYAVQGITMPKITGMTLSSNSLMKAWEAVKTFPNLVNQSEAEWGEYLEKWKACVFPTEEGWTILVWNRARPIRNEIRHELSHIWESLLGLQWGTLI